MAEVKYCPCCGSKLSVKKINGRDYQACHAENCDYVFWDNPLAVVAALIERNGEVLLVRNKAWPPKMYGLITGFLEKGESPQDAILREVKEETGLEAKLAGMIGVYPFLEKNQIIIAYYVLAEGEIKLGDELAEVKSVSPQKVRPWPFGTGLAVSDWLKARGIKQND